MDNPTRNGKKEHIYFTEMIEGECFGQTSLFDDKLPRFCIVSTLKPTHFLVIDNLAFKAMNRVYTARMEADCLQLLKECDLFRQFTQPTKKKMVKDFEKVQYTGGKALFVEDRDLAEYVYIVKSGEFMITKRIGIPQQDDHHTCIEDFAKQRIAVKSDKVRIEVVKLRIEGYAKLIGEQDVLFNRQYRTTARCIT